MSIFQRAKAYQNLLPVERAILRFVQTFLMVTGPIGSVPLVHDLQNALTIVAAGGAFPRINWQGDLSWIAYALFISFGLAVQKWHSATSDPALATNGAPAAGSPQFTPSTPPSAIPDTFVNPSLISTATFVPDPTATMTSFTSTANTANTSTASALAVNPPASLSAEGGDPASPAAPVEASTPDPVPVAAS